MGGFVLQALQDRRDPLLTYRWICTELPFNMDINYVESISLPFFNIDIGDSLFGAGTFFHYPSFSSLSSFTMTFYEDDQLTSSKWLTAWMSKIRNPSLGWYNLPSVYKRSINVRLYDNSEAVCGEVKLIGCWPSQISNLELNYTASERVIVNVTMSVDSVEFMDKDGWGEALFGSWFNGNK